MGDIKKIVLVDDIDEDYIVKRQLFSDDVDESIFIKLSDEGVKQWYNLSDDLRNSYDFIEDKMTKNFNEKPADGLTSDTIEAENRRYEQEKAEREAKRAKLQAEKEAKEDKKAEEETKEEENKGRVIPRLMDGTITKEDLYEDMREAAQSGGLNLRRIIAEDDKKVIGYRVMVKGYIAEIQTLPDDLLAHVMNRDLVYRKGEDGLYYSKREMEGKSYNLVKVV